MYQHHAPLTNLTTRWLAPTIAALMLTWSTNVLAQDAQAEAAIDMGNNVPTAQDVKEGLFPDDECEELKAAGFKCMGFKPAVKYSLPASSFALGSSVVPALLKRQLDVFAEVLRGKNGTQRKVNIIGHADASGSQAGNLELSMRRAAAVRDYLVQMGVDRSLIVAEGMGAKVPKNKADPYAAENRRVEIGRAK